MVKQLFRIMLMLALLLGAHGAPSGGWLSGVCGLSGAEAHAAQAFVFETGQTTSYATGDDGALRPGVAWPAPRFSDNGNGTVTDNLTGLIWLKNAGCFEMAIWDEALDISNNLASGVCGLSDGSTAGTWRLPNAKELESLVDLQNTDPALPSGHPFSNVQAAYWSSSTYAGYSSTISDYINHGTAAWMVDMEYGYMIWDDKPFWHAWSNYHYVWPVRGGQSGSLGLLNVYPAGNYFGDFFTNTHLLRTDLYHQQQWLDKTGCFLNRSHWRQQRHVYPEQRHLRGDPYHRAFGQLYNLRHLYPHQRRDKKNYPAHHLQ